MTYTLVRRIAACALCLLVAACTAGAVDPVGPASEPAAVTAPSAGDLSAAPDEPVAKTRGAGAPAGGGRDGSAEAIEEALDRALEEGWTQLHIRADCWTDAGPDAVEIFSRGVAIWNQRAQFALNREQLRVILQGFVSADFAHMQAQYGGDKRTEPLELNPDIQPGSNPMQTGEAPPQIICLLSLDLDGVAKQVVQFRGGAQSDGLQKLATHVLEICRQPAQAGVTAADLTDGLTKIASRELAPESLQILLHRKPLNGEGWLLQVRGERASTRRFVPGKGYEDPLSLALEPAEIEKLAQLLADLAFEDLPGNLFADHYTDLTVRVLNRRLKVQAMQFAGMTATQHGEQQKRFDLVYEELHALHESVLKNGR